MIWRKLSDWCIESDTHRIEKFVSEDTLKPSYRVIRYERDGRRQIGCTENPKDARELCECPYG